jgi:hypothetical protein
MEAPPRLARDCSFSEQGRTGFYCQSAGARNGIWTRPSYKLRCLETSPCLGWLQGLEDLGRRDHILGQHSRRLWVSRSIYIHSLCADNVCCSFTATVPTVINGLGYSSANAQLLTIPIYLFAMIVTLAFAWASDHYQQRSPFIIAGFSISAAGFIAQLAIPHPKYPGLTYGFLFPVAAGLYCPFICLVSWIGKRPV